MNRVPHEDSDEPRAAYGVNITGRIISLQSSKLIVRRSEERSRQKQPAATWAIQKGVLD